jgi:uncharacterized membrane protein HdeD (DUF308 family)
MEVRAMSQQLKAMMRQGTPWRRGIPWWLVIAEGVVAVAAGIAMLVRPQETASLIVIVFGGYLLVNGLLRIYAGIKTQSSRWGAMLASGLHILLGVLLLYARSDPSVTNWLGITALVIGALLVAYGLILHRSASRPAKAAREPTLGNG